MELLEFQNDFVEQAIDPEHSTVALSLPRGNGKSFIAGKIAADWFPRLKPYEEIALCAASVEQARIVFRFIRSLLGETGEYRYADSTTRCGITRKDGARLRVIGSNGKTAMGLVNTPLVVADEPGAWEAAGGQLLHDAIQTAQGKPGSPLKAIYIGTLAPATGGWWHQLCESQRPGHYVKLYKGDRKRWDDFDHVLAVNPLSAISEPFRNQLQSELDEALSDSRLKARFLSYRLNLPTRDETTMLLTVDEWERAVSRLVPDRVGSPIVGVDLGAGRAWSAAVAVWPNLRVEALAIAPGKPSIELQEKRDRVPKGTYCTLIESGQLSVAEGLHVPPPALLMERILDSWGTPRAIVCDFFRLAELRDVSPCRIAPRRTRWSEASEDIRGLRKLVKDTPLAIDRNSAQLIATSLTQATVKNDDQGNCRIVKTTENTARDDVAQAFTHAAGLVSRSPEPQELEVVIV